MLFPILKWLHILAAVTAIGSNLTYGIWIARASRSPDVLPFSLRTIKMIDDRLANPAYGLLLITGLTMVFVVKMPLTTPWLLTALVLYVLLALTGFLGYSPTLRKQIELLESQGAESAGYRAMSKRGTVIGIVVAVMAVTIIFLMVVKPALWA